MNTLTPDFPLVSLVDGEPRTTSLIIAEGTENEHASVIALVRNYINDLQDFGNVDFKSTLNPGQKRATEYAELNEGQATFLLTLMRNNEIVVAFKKRLVKAFLHFKSLLTDPLQALNDPATLQTMLLAVLKQREEDKLQIQQRDKMIAVTAPKAAALDRIANTDGLICISTGAKILKKGPKELFQWLFKNKWIFKRPGGKHWLAHQDKLRLGYLEHTLYTYTNSEGQEKSETQAYLTAKGIAKLAAIFGIPESELEVAA